MVEKFGKGPVIGMEKRRSSVDPRKRVLELENLVSTSRQIANMAEPTRLSKEELDAHKIIYPDMENRELVDSFRELRTKLVESAPGDNPITMVCSVTPCGGASYIALNLAVSFAFDASKTALLIDCNLKQPSLQDLLYLEPEFGLTDFLENEVESIDSIIYATGVPRLRLIPAGQRREATAEFFTSLRMRAFLDVIKRRYSDRHIFIDSPSIASSADAVILSNLCDRVILVVQYGRVTDQQVKSVVDSIGQDKIAGVILNN